MGRRRRRLTSSTALTSRDVGDSNVAAASETGQGAVEHDGGESRIKTSAASEIEECAVAHDGDNLPHDEFNGERGSSAPEPPTNATDEVQPCEALLKLRPSE